MSNFVFKNDRQAKQWDNFLARFSAVSPGSLSTCRIIEVLASDGVTKYTLVAPLIDMVLSSALHGQNINPKGKVTYYDGFMFVIAAHNKQEVMAWENAQLLVPWKKINESDAREILQLKSLAYTFIYNKTAYTGCPKDSFYVRTSDNTVVDVITKEEFKTAAEQHMRSSDEETGEMFAANDRCLFTEFECSGKSTSLDNLTIICNAIPTKSVNANALEEVRKYQRELDVEDLLTVSAINEVRGISIDMELIVNMARYYSGVSSYISPEMDQCFPRDKRYSKSPTTQQNTTQETSQGAAQASSQQHTTQKTPQGAQASSQQRPKQKTLQGAQASSQQRPTQETPQGAQASSRRQLPQEEQQKLLNALFNPSEGFASFFQEEILSGFDVVDPRSSPEEAVTHVIKKLENPETKRKIKEMATKHLGVQIKQYYRGSVAAGVSHEGARQLAISALQGEGSLPTSSQETIDECLSSYHQVLDTLRESRAEEDKEKRDAILREHLPAAMQDRDDIAEQERDAIASREHSISLPHKGVSLEELNALRKQNIAKSDNNVVVSREDRDGLRGRRSMPVSLRREDGYDRMRENAVVAQGNSTTSRGDADSSQTDVDVLQQVAQRAKNIAWNSYKKTQMAKNAVVKTSTSTNVNINTPASQGATSSVTPPVSQGTSVSPPVLIGATPAAIVNPPVQRSATPTVTVNPPVQRGATPNLPVSQGATASVTPTVSQGASISPPVLLGATPAAIVNPPVQRSATPTVTASPPVQQGATPNLPASQGAVESNSMSEAAGGQDQGTTSLSDSDVPRMLDYDVYLVDKNIKKRDSSSIGGNDICEIAVLGRAVEICWELKTYIDKMPYTVSAEEHERYTFCKAKREENVYKFLQACAGFKQESNPLAFSEVMHLGTKYEFNVASVASVLRFVFSVNSRQSNLAGQAVFIDNRARGGGSSNPFVAGFIACDITDSTDGVTLDTTRFMPNEDWDSILNTSINSLYFRDNDHCYIVNGGAGIYTRDDELCSEQEAADGMLRSITNLFPGGGIRYLPVSLLNNAMVNREYTLPSLAFFWSETESLVNSDAISLYLLSGKIDHFYRRQMSPMKKLHIVDMYSLIQILQDILYPSLVKRYAILIHPVVLVERTKAAIEKANAAARRAARIFSEAKRQKDNEEPLAVISDTVSMDSEDEIAQCTHDLQWEQARKQSEALARAQREENERLMRQEEQDMNLASYHSYADAILHMASKKGVLTIVNEGAIAKDDTSTVEPTVDVPPVADETPVRSKPVAAQSRPLTEAPKTAKPKDIATAKPKDIATAKPKAKPKDTATAKPKDIATAKPKDIATAKPKDTATAKPKDIATAKPKDIATAKPKAKPKDIATAKPKDTATAKPKDIATAKPKDIATAKLKRSLKILQQRSLKIAKPKAKPKDIATAKPKDTATAKPKDTATAKPKDIATAKPKAKPKDIATAKPKDIATAKSKDTATAKPKDIATAKPKDTATAKPKTARVLKPKIFPDSAVEAEINGERYYKKGSITVEKAKAYAAKASQAARGSRNDFECTSEREDVNTSLLGNIKGLMNRLNESPDCFSKTLAAIEPKGLSVIDDFIDMKTYSASEFQDSTELKDALASAAANASKGTVTLESAIPSVTSASVDAVSVASTTPSVASTSVDAVSVANTTPSVASTSVDTVSVTSSITSSVTTSAVMSGGGSS